MSYIQRFPPAQRGSEMIGRLMIYAVGMVFLLSVGFMLILRNQHAETPEPEFVFPIEPATQFEPRPGVHCYTWIISPSHGYTQCTDGVHGIHSLGAATKRKHEQEQGMDDARGWLHGTLFKT